MFYSINVAATMRFKQVVSRCALMRTVLDVAQITSYIINKIIENIILRPFLKISCAKLHAFLDDS